MAEFKFGIKKHKRNDSGVINTPLRKPADAFKSISDNQSASKPKAHKQTSMRIDRATIDRIGAFQFAYELGNRDEAINHALDVAAKVMTPQQKQLYHVGINFMKSHRK